jgi:hypothetical protein
MKQRIPAALGLDAGQTQGFFGDSAARFLGLARAADGTKPATRQRLEAFYKAHELDTSLLTRWDS